MRAKGRKRGLTVRAVAGTHTVLLGMDLTDPTRCLGFAIRRTDHTEGETTWLRGMKTFADVVADPPPGTTWPTNHHPIQGFQWGDYTAKPGRDYTYEVHAMGGTPTALSARVAVTVHIRTEVEDDGYHGVWFNRGVAGSQAFAMRFPDWVPGRVPDESHPAMVWLSRGLGEAFLAFVGEADGPEWGLHGAFYEFTWDTALSALRAAADRGVHLQLVVHGRDRDPANKDDDTTAADAHAHAAAAGLDPWVTWRDLRPKGTLSHNKFLVLTHRGAPVAVWTGSTNLTLGAVYGHSNVGHVIHDRHIAGQFHEYVTRLATGVTSAQLKVTHATDPEVVVTVPPSPGMTFVPSPRADLSALNWYAALFDSAASSAHITGAFGLNAVFREKLAVRRAPVTRTVLLDKRPALERDRIPLTDSHVRLSTGSHLASGRLTRWAVERLTGFNSHVRYVHTKIILVDPLGDDPVIVTGSANYSDASTRTNEENTVVIRHGTSRATTWRAVRRVADIYLTEYHRLFMHFAFRAMAEGVEVNTGSPRDDLHLSPSDAWARRYYEPGSWRESQRRLFSGS